MTILDAHLFMTKHQLLFNPLRFFILNWAQKKKPPTYMFNEGSQKPETWGLNSLSGRATRALHQPARTKTNVEDIWNHIGCMYVCMHVCLFIYVYVYLNGNVYVCKCTCNCLLVCLSVCPSQYLHVYPWLILSFERKPMQEGYLCSMTEGYHLSSMDLSCSG